MAGRGRREARRTVARRTHIPDYSRLGAYTATEQELVPLGVASTEELVNRANAHFIAIGQFPVTQGDYPTTRDRFERLVRRYLASSGQS